jgi:hypothetical protein
MATRFPPPREADLVSSAQNFDTKTTAAPTTFGLTAAQCTAFHTYLTALIAARVLTQDPLTRSPANIVAKNIAKANLIANYRLLAGIVQRFPATTNFTRAELGLPLRFPEPSPIPAPDFAPDVDIVSTAGLTVRIRLHNPATPGRRGRPDGVAGANIYTFVGATAGGPPADLSDWRFEGHSNRTVVDVAFGPATAPGATVWFQAAWYNPRGQAGPASMPVSANVPGVGAVAEAA